MPPSNSDIIKGIERDRIVLANTRRLFDEMGEREFSEFVAELQSTIQMAQINRRGLRNYDGILTHVLEERKLVSLLSDGCIWRDYCCGPNAIAILEACESYTRKFPSTELKVFGVDIRNPREPIRLNSGNTSVNLVYGDIHHHLQEGCLISYSSAPSLPLTCSAVFVDDSGVEGDAPYGEVPHHQKMNSSASRQRRCCPA